MVLSGARNAPLWTGATVQPLVGSVKQALAYGVCDKSLGRRLPTQRAFREALHVWAKAMWTDETGGRSGLSVL